MSIVNLFHLLFSALDLAKARYLVVGALAETAHGYDYLPTRLGVVLEEETFLRIFPRLAKGGYKTNLKGARFIRIRKGDSDLPIDFFFVERERLERLSIGAREVTVAERRFKIPSSENLLLFQLEEMPRILGRHSFGMRCRLPDPNLSMDEYLEFNELMAEYFPEWGRNRAGEETMTVPFRLK